MTVLGEAVRDEIDRNERWLLHWLHYSWTPEPTLATMERVCGQHGAEAFENTNLCALDVVGRRTVALDFDVEQHRPPGVRVRWFPTHRTRIAELGERIEAARRRSW